jgi:hypothetical protein
LFAGAGHVAIELFDQGFQLRVRRGMHRHG